LVFKDIAVDNGCPPSSSLKKSDDSITDEIVSRNHAATGFISITHNSRLKSIKDNGARVSASIVPKLVSSKQCDRPGSGVDNTTLYNTHHSIGEQ
jgi:hypothetical protein